MKGDFLSNFVTVEGIEIFENTNVFRCQGTDTET